jgi:hypothetical protein
MLSSPAGGVPLPSIPSRQALSRLNNHRVSVDSASGDDGEAHPGSASPVGAGRLSGMGSGSSDALGGSGGVSSGDDKPPVVIAAGMLAPHHISAALAKG